jgi:hypothetical protein
MTNLVVYYFVLSDVNPLVLIIRTFLVLLAWGVAWVTLTRLFSGEGKDGANPRA